METPWSRDSFANVSPFLIFTQSGFVEEAFGEEDSAGAGVNEGVERVLAEGS